MKKLKTFIVIILLIASVPLSAQQQPYYFNKILEGGFEEITEKLISALKNEGFGVITEIDMHNTLKEKLPDVELKPYKILGVCNPGFAYKTLQIEENIGIFLPCKALVKELGEEKTEVVIVNPAAVMSMLGKPELVEIATEVSEKFESALNKL